MMYKQLPWVEKEDEIGKRHDTLFSYYIIVTILSSSIFMDATYDIRLISTAYNLCAYITYINLQNSVSLYT